MHQYHKADLGSRFNLLGLVALLAAAGAGLLALAGPPRLPRGMPTADQVRSLLTGSTLPLDGLAYVLSSLAWLVWVWIVASLALELLLVVAESLAHGAAWVRGLRTLANRLSMPLARRAVAAAFAVQVLSRGIPVAAAAPVEPGHQVLVVATEPDAAAAGDRLAHRPEPAPPAHEYRVRPGDTLWSIAQAEYGSGTEYRRLVEANVGRRMPDGRRFAAHGVIQPGWVLRVPEPSRHVEHVDGQRWYTVQPGETLSGIAARLLDDEARWSELFELNRGVAHVQHGPTLQHPNVIWPGLRLRLPSEAAPTTPAPAADPSAASGEPELTTAQAGPPATTTSTPTTTLPVPGVPDDPSSAAESASRPRALAAIGPRIEVSPPVVAELQPVEQAMPEPTTPAESLEPDDASAGSEPAAPVALPNPLDPRALELVGLAAAAGAAGLGVRRLRRLRPLPQEPESEVVVQGGYAEAQVAHEFARRLQGSDFDPATAVIRHLLGLLNEHGLAGVQVLSVRHGRSAITLTLIAGLADQPRVLELAPVLGEQLGAEVEAHVSSDQDVVVRLARLRRMRLLPPAGTTPGGNGLLLLPMGVLYDRQVFLANWSQLGHVVVASLPGHGAQTILTSLLASLTARRSPDELRVWTIAQPRSLPAPLAHLPHQAHAVDPTDDAALSAFLDDVRAELDRRLSPAGGPDLVVVVADLASLGQRAADLHLLAMRAAAQGVRLLAATSDPLSVPDDLYGMFSTRMVLQMDDEQTSVRLLGVADAAFLGGGGRLLLRIDGREPVELYGYHVATEHLERLVRVMRSVYAGPGPVSPPPPPPAPGGAAQPSPRPAPERPTREADEPLAEPDQPLAPVSSVAEAAAPPPVSSVAEAAHPPAEAPAPPLVVHPDRHAAPHLAVVEPPGPPAAPPIQIVCFGGPRVLCLGQQVWPRLGAGAAKPWELLLYLACQPPEGVSREAVSEALWPDDDLLEGGFTHRVRQLRYRLRTAFEAVPGGPTHDGISLERGGALRLDPRVAESDVQRFLQLVRSARMLTGQAAIARYEQARALYVSDLLDASDARHYAWAIDRGEDGVTLREHFRRLYYQATSSLAELCARADDPGRAIELYRELTELEPGDERLWIALLRVIASRGDRPALVREERRYRDALRGLDGDRKPSNDAAAEPSREVSLEFQRLLKEVDARQRTPTAV